MDKANWLNLLFEKNIEPSKIPYVMGTEVKIVNESGFDNPSYATLGSAGVDVRSTEEYTLAPMERHIFNTKLKMQIPFGYEIQVRPRSGLACKHGITVINTPGTIDADYTGYIGVCLINLSNEAYKVEKGERIAQLVLKEYELFSFENVDTLDETERGDGSYGHSGR